MSALVDSLSHGRVILYPTETIWGLGADIRFGEAHEKIRSLKNREEGKYFSLLVKDISMAKDYSKVEELSEELMRKYWPGPLTLILDSKENVPDYINSGGGTVGLRCSSHPFVVELYKDYEFPISTTSANKSGTLELINEEQLSSIGAFKVQGEVSVSATPSTIVRIDDRSKSFHIVRNGAVDTASLVEIATQFQYRVNDK